MVRRKPPRSLANSAFRAPRCTNCWRFWSVTDWSPALPSSARTASDSRLSSWDRPILANIVYRSSRIHLAVLHGNEIIYVIEERAAHRPPLVSGVGVRLPSHLTATGRAILSALPRNQVRALYPNRQAFTDRTGIGPKSPKELEATLAETQRTGFAEEHGDVTPGFDSYAVAVRDYNDFPIAGLALTFVSGSLRPEQERSLKTKLRLAGTELSRRLGAVGSLT